MKNNMNINMRQVLKTILYSSLFLLLGLTLPLFLLFVPAPFILTRLDSSHADAFLSCIGLFILVLSILDLIPALAVVLFVFIVFVPVGEFINDGAEDYLTISVTSIGILLGIILLGVSLYYFHDISVIESIRQSFHQVLDLVSKEAPNIEEFVNEFKSMEDLIIDSLPSFIISFSFLTSFLNVYFVKNRSKNPKVHAKRRAFSSYRISLKVLGILGIFVAGFYMLSRAGVSYGELLYFNGLSVLTNFLLFNGVSFGDYLLKKLPKGFRFLIPAIIIAFGFSIIYIGLGALDTLFNFRQRLPRSVREKIE